MLECQYPIVRNIAPKCTKPAEYYNYYGWALCEEHHQEGDTPLAQPNEPATDRPASNTEQ